MYSGTRVRVQVCTRATGWPCVIVRSMHRGLAWWFKGMLGADFLRVLDQTMDFEAIDSVAIWSVMAILSSVTYSVASKHTPA